MTEKSWRRNCTSARIRTRLAHTPLPPLGIFGPPYPTSYVCDGRWANGSTSVTGSRPTAGTWHNRQFWTWFTRMSSWTDAPVLVAYGAAGSGWSKRATRSGAAS